MHLPLPAGGLTAKRSGSDVVLQFTIPEANTDRTTPADVVRVEVYAHTGPLPTPQDYVKFGTLVAILPIKPPVTAAQVQAAQSEEQRAESKEQAGASGEILEQGWATSVSETLTAAHLEPGLLPYARPLPTVPVVEVVETPGTVNLPPPIMRYYVVTGVSRNNRSGLSAGPIGVPLTQLPPPVDGVTTSYTQDALSLTWTPPVTGALGYNVYQVEPPGEEPVAPKLSPEAAAKAGPGLVGPPKLPANPALLVVPAFTDRVEFGAIKCYAVRTVTTAVAIVVESDPSAPACVTARDTFPPASPGQLAAVSDDQGVSLIWNQNTELDLAGYMVLRGEAPGETLAPLTTTPIRETTYRDSTVQSGHTYVYAVVALDRMSPPNVSEPSNRVTEVTR
ncbi:MAG: hypothetical protein EXQ55_05805 [Acidobacteria bacterium]|nr:hypothetical protein [Acidobacteriota bacterium]